MFLCDGNIWLALCLAGHAHHAVARDWLEGTEEGGSVVFCRATQQTLLRLLTNAAVFAPYGLPPRTNAEAWEAYDALVADDRITLRTDEPAGLQPTWRDYAVRDSASPKLWMDAYLAAFAQRAGFQLVTTDRGFRQFRGLDLLLLTSSTDV